MPGLSKFVMTRQQQIALSCSGVCYRFLKTILNMVQALESWNECHSRLDCRLQGPVLCCIICVAETMIPIRVERLIIRGKEVNVISSSLVRVLTTQPIDLWISLCQVSQGSLLILSNLQNGSADELVNLNCDWNHLHAVVTRPMSYSDQRAQALA